MISLDQVREAYTQDMLFDAVSTWVKFGWLQELSKNIQSEELKLILKTNTTFTFRMIVHGRADY